MAGKYFNFYILGGKIQFNLSKILCSSADEIARGMCCRSNRAIKNNILRCHQLLINKSHENLVPEKNVSLMFLSGPVNGLAFD